MGPAHHCVCVCVFLPRGEGLDCQALSEELQSAELEKARAVASLKVLPSGCVSNLWVPAPAPYFFLLVDSRF